MSYDVQLITSEEKDLLFEAYGKRFLYTNKAEIYGCCIKLLTDSETIKNKWEDNFYTADENTRSHGRIVVLTEPGQPLSVKYDIHKDCFLNER